MNRSAESAARDRQLSAARRKSLFWRIHFWAAMIASPIALIAACTGILYIFTPQIESALYGSLDRVPPAATMRPLDEAVAAAKAAAPSGLDLRFVVPPYDKQDSVKVYFVPSAAKGEHEGHHHGADTGAVAAQPAVVYVNPYNAQVLGSQVEAERFVNWSKKLHSSLLQGDGWRWMIELAASWLMILLLTGIYLWWPDNARKILPRKCATGRSAWKQWHAFLGVALFLMSLTIVATGLTWSKYAGGRIRIARDITGQAPPQVPRNLKSAVIEGAQPLNWQAAWDAARRQAPDVAMQLTAPRHPGGVWRAASVDTSRFEKKFDLLLDAYSGKQLYFAGWDEQTAFAKATAIGIPFHRGEFGWWNQALLLLFGIGVLFSLVSGWVMYFKRRQPGTFGLPHLMPDAWKAAPAWAWLAAAVLCAIAPLLMLSALVVLLLEFLLHRCTQEPAVA